MHQLQLVVCLYGDLQLCSKHHAVQQTLRRNDHSMTTDDAPCTSHHITSAMSCCPSSVVSCQSHHDVHLLSSGVEKVAEWLLHDVRHLTYSVSCDDLLPFSVSCCMTVQSCRVLSVLQCWSAYTLAAVVELQSSVVQVPLSAKHNCIHC